MFEVVGQDIISGNMGFIGTDPDRLYRMGAAEKEVNALYDSLMAEMEELNENSEIV